MNIENDKFFVGRVVISKSSGLEYRIEKTCQVEDLNNSAVPTRTMYFVNNSWYTKGELELKFYFMA